MITRPGRDDGFRRLKARLVPLLESEGTAEGTRFGNGRGCYLSIYLSIS